jgi:hypothetical protein
VRPPPLADPRDRVPGGLPIPHVSRTESERFAASAGKVVERHDLPLGARVWLPRTGWRGRVVVRVLDGLLYRVRLNGEAGRLREYPACELELLPGQTSADRSPARGRLSRGAGSAAGCGGPV